MTTERLEQVEELVAVLVTHAEANDRRLGQLADGQLLIQQDIQLLTTQIGQVGERVDLVAATVEAIAQQSAEREARLEDRFTRLNATVERFLDALDRRFTSNGHGE